MDIKKKKERIRKTCSMYSPYEVPRKEYTDNQRIALNDMFLSQQADTPPLKK